MQTHLSAGLTQPAGSIPPSCNTRVCAVCGATSAPSLRRSGRDVYCSACKSSYETSTAEKCERQAEADARTARRHAVPKRSPCASPAGVRKAGLARQSSGALQRHCPAPAASCSQPLALPRSASAQDQPLTPTGGEITTVALSSSGPLPPSPFAPQSWLLLPPSAAAASGAGQAAGGDTPPAAQLDDWQAALSSGIDFDIVFCYATFQAASCEVRRPRLLRRLQTLQRESDSTAASLS